MEKEMNDVSSIRQDTSTKTILTRPSVTLAGYLDTYTQNKLRSQWRYYNDQHHLSVYRPAIYDALKFLLKPQE